MKLSGWMMSYTRALKEILSERNKHIDIATSTNVAEGLDSQSLEEQIRIQAHIGKIEVINSLMLFEQFQATCKKLEKIGEGYKNVFGVHLKMVPPAPLESTLRDLRRIAEFPP